MSKKTILGIVLGLLALVALILVLPAGVRSVLGYVLLGLLAVLVLLLVLPVTVHLRLQHGTFTVKLRLLFIKLTVLPFKEKPQSKKEQKKKPAKEPKEEEEKKPKPKRTPEEILTLVKRIASSAGVLMKRVLRHIRVQNLQLVVPVQAEEAADVAIRCGQLQMLLGATRAVLEGRLRISYKRLVIMPDFASQYGDSLLFSCKITASPVILLAAAIAAGIHFLRYKPVAYSKQDYLRAHPRKPSSRGQQAAP